MRFIDIATATIIGPVHYRVKGEDQPMGHNFRPMHDQFEELRKNNPAYATPNMYAFTTDIYDEKTRRVLTGPHCTCHFVFDNKKAMLEFMELPVPELMRGCSMTFRHKDGLYRKIEKLMR